MEISVCQPRMWTFYPLPVSYPRYYTRISASNEYQQLFRSQAHQALWSPRPVPVSSLAKSFVTKPLRLAVEKIDSDPGTPPVNENKHCAAVWILLQELSANTRRPVDPFPCVYRFPGYKNTHMT